MFWTTSWKKGLIAVTFLAFFIGAVASNTAIVWTKHRKDHCPQASSAEDVLNKFLTGFNYFCAVFNSLGALVTLIGLAKKLEILSTFKTIIWLLKDFLLGLSLTAAIVTLMALLDVRRSNPDCPMNTTAKVTMALDTLSITFCALYIIFRILMVFAKVY
jgi:hypothetical protein